MALIDCGMAVPRFGLACGRARSLRGRRRGGKPPRQQRLGQHDGSAQLFGPPPRPRHHGAPLLGMPAMAEPAVALADRPAAPPPMHAADPLAPQRRLPAIAPIPAMRLAARRPRRVSAPVAVAQRPRAHGADWRGGGGYYPICFVCGAQGGEVRQAGVAAG